MKAILLTASVVANLVLLSAHFADNTYTELQACEQRANHYAETMMRAEAGGTNIECYMDASRYHRDGCAS